jgi:hypothetical protein
MADRMEHRIGVPDWIWSAEQSRINQVNVANSLRDLLGRWYAIHIFGAPVPPEPPSLPPVVPVLPHEKVLGPPEYEVVGGVWHRVESEPDPEPEGPPDLDELPDPGSFPFTFQYPARCVWPGCGETIEPGTMGVIRTNVYGVKQYFHAHHPGGWNTHREDAP